MEVDASRRVIDLALFPAALVIDIQSGLVLILCMWPPLRASTRTRSHLLLGIPRAVQFLVSMIEAPTQYVYFPCSLVSHSPSRLQSRREQ